MSIISKIIINTKTKEITLTTKEAEELYTELSKMFGKKEVLHHYYSAPKPYYYPWWVYTSGSSTASYTANSDNVAVTYLATEGGTTGGSNP